MVTDMLLELQAFVARYYGTQDMEIDPDCPIRDMGIDAVGLKDLIVAVEDKYTVDTSVMLDENCNVVTLERNLKEKTLRELAQCITQLLCDRDRSGIRKDACRE